MKTYLLGARFGITLLLGVTVLFGTAATTYTGLADQLITAPTAAVAVGVSACSAGSCSSPNRE